MFFCNRLVSLTKVNKSNEDDGENYFLLFTKTLYLLPSFVKERKDSGFSEKSKNLLLLFLQIKIYPTSIIIFSVLRLFR